jgi:hypothetical protein
MVENQTIPSPISPGVSEHLTNLARRIGVFPHRPLAEGHAASHDPQIFTVRINQWHDLTRWAATSPGIHGTSPGFAVVNVVN